jgi:hypothetical protein
MTAHAVGQVDGMFLCEKGSEGLQSAEHHPAALRVFDDELEGLFLAGHVLAGFGATTGA